MLVLSTHNGMWFAGNGQPLTLVCTDVEGSTEVGLWFCVYLLSASVVWRHFIIVSYVLTLVLGLQLWEWDPASTDTATRLHDQIMRSALLECYGHELATEG